jgi:hypothetical protein
VAVAVPTGGDLEDEVLVVGLGEVQNDRRDGSGAAYFQIVGSIVYRLSSRRRCIKAFRIHLIKLGFNSGDKLIPPHRRPLKYVKIYVHCNYCRINAKTASFISSPNLSCHQPQNNCRNHYVDVSFDNF